MKKYNKDYIYTTKNTIKITVNQTGTKSMIREQGQDKATMRQGFIVIADNECINMGDWNETENQLLLDTIKQERYAHLAYKEAYYDLLQQLESIGFFTKEEEDDF
jgi:hypothetical protein